MSRTTNQSAANASRKSTARTTASRKKALSKKAPSKKGPSKKTPSKKAPSKKAPSKKVARATSSGGLSLRERMSRDLQLRGMSQRTHDGYLREVRKLACYHQASPDTLSERQVGDYLLYLINDCEFAPGSLSVAYSGIKFFYTHTEPRDWDVLKKLRRPKKP